MTAKKQTPEELLAQDIVADLRKQNLLSTRQLDGLAEKLTLRRVTAEDWQVMIEKAVDSEERGKNAR